MSKRYTQLTEAERYHIYTMKKQGYTDTVIAQGMGAYFTESCHPFHVKAATRNAAKLPPPGA